MGALYVKDGVEFATIAPGGFEILRAITEVAKELDLDLMITSGTDGEHSGPLDPHKLGRAYDMRSYDFISGMKYTILSSVMAKLGITESANGAPDYSTTTEKFFGWLEDSGAPNEHFHIQQRHNVEFP